MARPGVLPAAVLAEAARRLGAPVTATAPLQGGYTPQLLLRLHLADGRTAVAKAVATLDAPDELDWPAVLRGEIAAYRSLPALAPWRPRCYGAFALGEWVVLLLEDLSGAGRVPPWTGAAIASAATALGRMHAATVGHRPPTGLPGPEAPPAHFAELLARGRTLGLLPARWDTAEGWRWLEHACWAGQEAMLAGWDDGPFGVIHGDVRSDNLFLRAGQLLLIDWSEAKWASLAREGVYWALGVEAEGGPPAPDVYARYLAAVPAIPRSAARAYLARFTGYLLERLQAAASPPGVQAYWATMLRPTLRWFAEELGLALPG